jgi:hypothetical protein
MSSRSERSTCRFSTACTRTMPFLDPSGGNIIKAPLASVILRTLSMRLSKMLSILAGGIVTSFTNNLIRVRSSWIRNLACSIAWGVSPVIKTLEGSRR